MATSCGGVNSEWTSRERLAHRRSSRYAFYIQAFEGYGETLRDYGQRASLAGRIGVAFVR